MLSEPHILRVERAFELAERNESKLPPEILRVQGMTSVKIRHFLNNLCDSAGCRYLEVGSFMGATALAASFRSPGQFIAVDNFSEFKQARAKDSLLRNLSMFANDCRVQFFECDCWELAQTFPERSINIYFYDGEHTEAAQEAAFVRFARVLDDPFIAIVDDWNLPAVRHGTNRAFQGRFEVVHAWERTTPGNGYEQTWWNGFYVALLRHRGR